MRMVIRALALAAFFQVSTSVDVWSEQDSLIRGDGNVSCGRWSENHKDDYNAETAGEDEWLLGWISGAEQMGPTKGLLNKIDNAGLAAWISNYCAAHPLDNLNKAALALLSEASDHAVRQAIDSLNAKPH